MSTAQSTRRIYSQLNDTFCGCDRIAGSLVHKVKRPGTGIVYRIGEDDTEHADVWEVAIRLYYRWEQAVEYARRKLLEMPTGTAVRVLGVAVYRSSEDNYRVAGCYYGPSLVSSFAVAQARTEDAPHEG